MADEQDSEIPQESEKGVSAVAIVAIVIVILVLFGLLVVYSDKLFGA